MRLLRRIARFPMALKMAIKVSGPACQLAAMRATVPGQRGLLDSVFCAHEHQVQVAAAHNLTACLEVDAVSQQPLECGLLARLCCPRSAT